MTEIDELDRDYAAGKFAKILKDLESFVKNNRDNILKFKDRLSKLKGSALQDDFVLKMYIMQIRSINPSEEIRAQLGEIEREIWIRGETMGKEPDRKLIAREWCQRHAPGWRDHRVMEIIYVVDRNRDLLIRLLQ